MIYKTNNGIFWKAVLFILILNGCSNQEKTNSITSTEALASDFPPTFQFTQQELLDSKGIILKFKPTISLLDQQQILNSVSLKQVYRFKLVPGLVYAEPENIDLLISSVNKLKDSQGIAYAEPDIRISVNSTIPTSGINKPVSSSQVKSQQPQESIRDIETLIAVIDTGVDYNHSQLKDNIWINQGEIPRNNLDDDGNGWVDDIYGWNFVENDNNPMDYHQHGTHVAGIVSGKIGDEAEFTNTTAKIVVLRVMDENGQGRISYLLKAFEYLIDNKISLSSNGWGLGKNSIALFDSMQSINKINHLFLVSAGDDGFNLDEKEYFPASHEMDNMLSVASLSASNQLSLFSNYSANSIEVAVYGENIRSIAKNDKYLTFSGSSVASAIAMNLMLKVKSLEPDISMHQLKQKFLTLVNSSDQLSGKIKLNKAISNWKIFPDVTGGSVTENTGNTSDPATNTDNSGPSVGDAGNNSLLFSIDSPGNTISIGESVQLKMNGGVAPYSFKVTNKLFANVDSSGLVTGLTVGSTGVSATDANGTVSNEIVVSIVPMSIQSITGNAISINVESEFSAKGGVPPYSWSVDGDQLATGTIIGNDTSVFVVTPKLAGTIKLTLKDLAGNTATSGEISISALPLKVNPAALQMTLQQAKQLSASGGVSPYNWYSSNTNVISVNDTGMVTAVSPGNANVIVTDTDNRAQTVAVVVLPELTINTLKSVLKPGEKLQLAASGGSGAYQWVSSDSSIATIDNTGVVTAVKAGQVSMVVQDQLANSGSIQLEVRVVSITASKKVLSVNDAPVQLQVGGGVAPYQWTVNDSSIATISSKGLLTSVSSGTVNVTVTDVDGFTASITLTIDPAPLTLSHNNAVLSIGDSLQLLISGGSGSYLWSSSNSNIVSVSSTGFITALAQGLSEIAVVDSLGNSLVVSVTVDSIGISVKSTSVLLSDSGLQLSATGGSGIFSWLSSDTNIAIIDSNGLLTPLNVGEVLITVTDSNNVSASVNIVVTTLPIVASSDKTLLAMSDMATTTVSGGDGNYTWNSSNTSILAVSNTGIVTAVGVGVASITISDSIGQSMQLNYEVREVVLSASKTSIFVGDPALILEVTGGAAPYTWSSSNNTVATVSENGMMVAQSDGLVTITATDSDGFSDSIDVTIAYTPMSITQSTKLFHIDDTAQFAATGGDYQYVWSSSNTQVASVGTNGIVTAKLTGLSTITVTDKSGHSFSVSIEVRTVTVSSSKVNLIIGESAVQLIASGGAAPYSWQSSNSSIISVSASGYISALDIGSATVSATDADGFMGLIVINATSSPLLLANSSTILAVGQQVNVGISGGNGSYSWSSSNNGIATVTSEGVIKGITAGTATITVTDGLAQSKTISVEVRSVVVSAASSTVDINSTGLQLGASGGAGPYNWSSSNSTVATVNASGLLIPIKTGSVVVTASDSDGISGTRSITVTATNVALDKSSGLTGIGGTVQLTASGGKNIYTWSSSNNSIATVNSSGSVSGIAKGSVTITVTDGLGQTATATIEIRQVTVSASSSSVNIGNNLQISASGGATPYSWSVNNSNGSVSGSGVLTGSSAGSVTVTATDSDGFKGSVTITITVPPMSINSNSALLAINATKQITVSGGDGSYTWSSSNTSVATVNSSGLVTAKATGTATITVRDNSGNSKTATIEVRRVSLTASTASVNVGSTLQVSASGGAGPYTWSSSSSTVASVSSSGLVTGVAAGTVTINATDSDGFSGTISITVNAIVGGGGGGGH